MALKRTFMIGVMLVCGTLTGATWGQNHTPGTVFERTPDSAHSLPFASPGVFDYDTQLFAPLEFTNGKEKAPGKQSINEPKGFSQRITGWRLLVQLRA